MTETNEKTCTSIKILNQLRLEKASKEKAKELEAINRESAK